MAYLLALTILFAPTYAVRFELFGLPANLLMFWVFGVWAIFAFELILKKQARFLRATSGADNAKILPLAGLFLLAGLISLFWERFTPEKLGQFIVLYLQPISIFIIARHTWQKSPESKRWLIANSYWLLVVLGLLAVIQYFTLTYLPVKYWGNSVEPKRALGLFVHPNFYALFSAPLLAFLIPDVAQSLKSKTPALSLSDGLNLKPAAWLLGAIGLGLSLSRAGWLGLGIAGLVYLFFFADKRIKKIASVVAMVIVIVIVTTPNLRWRALMPFYGERSAGSRGALWASGWAAIKTSPIFGLGLNGYAQNYKEFQKDPDLDRHNYPHNIFLNFWVENGLLGLINFILLAGLIIYRGLRDSNNAFKLGGALFFIALLFQGLLDNPYFKNDLAMTFWIILSLTL